MRRIAFGALLGVTLLAMIVPSSAGFQKKRTSAKKTAKKKTVPVRKASTQAPSDPSRVEELLTLARQTPVENVGALVPFFEQLYRHQTTSEGQGLHILHYGDSHTAADEWTGFMRALFQNRFGDGGNGYSFAGRPWNSYRRMDLRSFGSKGWYSDGLAGRSGDGMYGLGGVSVTATRPRETVAIEATCESLEVYYLQQPGGGSFHFYDNGVMVEKVSTAGDLGPGFLRYTPTPGFHRFEIETLDRSPVRLFGWVTEQGRGVTYETLGINGAQASIVFGWEEKILASHINRRNPALIVLAYGTNEAGNKDWTEERYRDMFASLIHRFRQMAPTASILVVGPPDRYIRVRNRGWQVYEPVDRIIEAQRQAALGTGCAFWDMRAKMGGKGSMRQWVSSGLAQADYVHFTAAGYRILGGAVFQDLMDHFGTFLKVRQQLIGQSNSNGQTSENP